MILDGWIRSSLLCFTQITHGGDFITSILNFKQKLKKEMSSDNCGKASSGIGIIGVMTETTRAAYENILINNYSAPVYVAYHDVSHLRYDGAVSSSLQDQFKEDAEILKQDGVTHLTSAVLEYEPLVEKIANELGLKMIRLSQTLANNCKTLQLNEKKVGIVSLTNNYDQNSVLGCALSAAGFKGERLGANFTIDCVQDLLAKKQDYLAEILADIHRESGIDVIILSCPELYTLHDDLKKELPERPKGRKIIVWNTIPEHEYLLRFVNLAAE